jgi:hypothetical protein
MKIVNEALRNDLQAGRPVRLNLGSGKTSREGFYNVDLVALDTVDMVADLNRPLDGLPDNSVAQVVCKHTLEHIQNIVGILSELHRVVRPEGQIEIAVPHFSNPYGYSDPTHVHFFGLFSMYYFADMEDQPRRKVPCHYGDSPFIVEKIRIRFHTRGLLDGSVSWLIRGLVNINYFTQHCYERRFAWLWPASEIRYVIRPKK